ncbi:MAG: hypothetical protein L0241_04615 [Planctomycetia bacterium]|nr:hypothetical protein [Planctomycetia bacterium]
MNQTTLDDDSLKWLLRVIGGIELCAIPFLLFPFLWMNEVHDRLLGLGQLPQAPIVEYMARSLSALYAVHGAVVFRLSFDIPRFRPVVRFLGWVHLALGAAVFAIDFSAGLPWWWVAGEGPGIATGGLLVLLLTRREVIGAESNSPKENG